MKVQSTIQRYARLIVVAKKEYLFSSPCRVVRFSDGGEWDVLGWSAGFMDVHLDMDHDCPLQKGDEFEVVPGKVGSIP